MRLHIFVVSLSSEFARRESVARQLLGVEASWSFFDAVSYKEIDVKARWGERALAAAEARLGRPVTLGEIACSESHFEVYRTVASSEFDAAIVLEDDFIASPRFSGFIRELSGRISNKFDVLIIGYSKLSEERESSVYKFEPILPQGLLGSVQFGKVWREWTCGTVGYVLTKQAAIRLVESTRFYTIADDWAALSAFYRLNVSHLRPLVVYEDFENFESSIEVDRSVHLKPYKKWLDIVRHARGYARLVAMKLGCFGQNS